MPRLLWLFCVAAGVASASRVSFLVPPSTVECFHKDVLEGAPVYVSSLVASGGRLDASIVLTDPNGVVVFQEPHSSSLRFVFKARATGRFTLCIANEVAMSADKQVILHFETDSEYIDRHRPHGTINLGAGDRGIDENDPIRRSLARITEGTTNLIDELAVSRARHAAHFDLAEQASSMLDLSGVVLTAVTVIFGFAQGFYFWCRIKEQKVTRARA